GELDSRARGRLPCRSSHVKSATDRLTPPASFSSSPVKSPPPTVSTGMPCAAASSNVCDCGLAVTRTSHASFRSCAMNGSRKRTWGVFSRSTQTQGRAIRFTEVCALPAKNLAKLQQDAHTTHGATRPWSPPARTALQLHHKLRGVPLAGPARPQVPRGTVPDDRGIART